MRLTVLADVCNSKKWAEALLNLPDIDGWAIAIYAASSAGAYGGQFLNDWAHDKISEQQVRHA
jgi:hypothetical protein